MPVGKKVVPRAWVIQTTQKGNFFLRVDAAVQTSNIKHVVEDGVYTESGTKYELQKRYSFMSPRIKDILKAANPGLFEKLAAKDFF